MNPEDNVEEDGDYYIDEKNKNVSLSWKWIEKLENIIWINILLDKVRRWTFIIYFSYVQPCAVHSIFDAPLHSI